MLQNRQTFRGLTNQHQLTSRKPRLQPCNKNNNRTENKNQKKKKKKKEKKEIATTSAYDSNNNYDIGQRYSTDYCTISKYWGQGERIKHSVVCNKRKNNEYNYKLEKLCHWQNKTISVKSTKGTKTLNRLPTCITRETTNSRVLNLLTCVPWCARVVTTSSAVNSLCLIIDSLRKAL